MRYKKELIKAVMKQQNISFQKAVDFLKAAYYERSVMRDLKKINWNMQYRKYY